MTRRIQSLAILVVILGILGVLAGGAFIGIAIQKNNYIMNSLHEQKITLGLTKDQIAAGEVVDNLQKVQVAANTIAQHLKGIAPTYTALMASSSTGKYDPTNAQQLDYAQGMNIANSLNLVILGYGVVQEALGTGVVLIVLGLGILGAGAMQLMATRRAS